MKVVFFVLVIIFSLVVTANVSGNKKYRIEVEASVPNTCYQCKTAKPFVTLKEIGSYIDNIGEDIGWKNKCESFVKDEMIGYYGKYIRSIVGQKGAFPNFKAGDPDLNRLCPNFSKMSDNNKANVAVLLLAAMSFEESTCNNKEVARGPNGLAAGFLQLHLGKESRYSKDCDNYDSRTPEGNLSCGLAIIDKQMAQGNLFRQDTNYWDVLRPKRYLSKKKIYVANPSYSKIRKAIASFPPCYDASKMMRGMVAKEVDSQIYRVIEVNHISKPVDIEITDALGS